MGFLRRFLSLGSKKNKKQSLQIVHNVPLDSNNQLVPEDSESAANRLLRSSSSRYRVVEEVDYASLPPIPHPINNVLNTPSASTVSLVSTSVSQRATFSAKVHKRECHTPAQLEDVKDTFESSGDKDTSRLLRLRSDPSVASLLDMYDEHGRISPEAFTNSPPSPQKQGRAQTRRSGSTLRQLLGNPTSGQGSESDISWAEKESDAASSASSLALQTPNNFDDHFPDDPLINAPNELSLTSDYDLSNTPGISSMEVELSMSSNNVSFEAPIEKSLPDTYKTPRRASEVFDFLTNKRRSQGADSECPPKLPAKDSQNSPPYSHCRSHFSPDSSFETPAIPASHNDTLQRSPDFSNNLDPSLDESFVIHEGTQARKVKIIMTNPTTVMVTAPTPGTHANLPPSRIPRGPRAQMRKVSYGNLKERRPTTSNSTGEPFTPMPSRRRKSRPRIISPTPSENDPPLTVKPREKVRRVSKEKAGLHAKPEIPLTPIRTNTNRSPLFRSAVDPGLYLPPEGTMPSPASSSEMSPVGQRMMMDARRNRARQKRKNSRSGV